MFTKKPKMRIRIKLINSYNLIKNILNLLKFALLIKECKTDMLMLPKYSFDILRLILILDLILIL